MTHLVATLITARGKRWIDHFHGAKFLHIFENSSNLINDSGEILSIVNPRIGPGPFNLVLKQKIDHQKSFQNADQVEIDKNILSLGGMQINANTAETWDAIPDWRAMPNSLVKPLIRVIDTALKYSEIKPGIAFSDPPDPGDFEASKAYAHGLAGLGPGLTPSGDDVLMGWMHAIWTCFPSETASAYAQPIAATAAPRTTSISAAWLNAAAEGEAGVLWHQLLREARDGNEIGIRSAAERILPIGHTSGADALAGFSAGLKKIGRV